MRNKKKRPMSRGRRNLIFFLLGTAAIGAFLLSVKELSKKPVLILSEILTANRGILADADGEYSDFIEIYNAGEVKVNLKGYFLSDNTNKPLRWQFPSYILEPGAYYYVFASSKDCLQADGVPHTNFSLSAAGEPVVLSDPQGNLVDRAEPFTAVDNVSYAYIEELQDWAYLAIATPGTANTGAYALDPSDLLPSSAQILITEYMSQNSSVFPDEDNQFWDWAELYNPGQNPVSLVGWTLSDNQANPLKWAFPAGVSIGPGEYLTLYCSGLDKPGHISFRLSAHDQTLTLSDPNGRTVDSIQVFDTPLDVSYGKLPDGSAGYFTKPTPGAAAESTPVSDLSSIEWEAPPVRISEYMSSNNFYIPDEDGDYNDWAELFNYGAEAVNLTGFFLSDREAEPDKWEFPEGSVIAPGERLVIQLSGKKRPGHATFSLGSGDDCLFLGDRTGRVIDKLPLVIPQDHVSYGRDETHPDTLLFYPLPTPGKPNDTEGFTELGGITALSWRGLFISEVSHDNWVEIGNASSETLSAAGWMLSDNPSNLGRMELPDVTIKPGEFKKIDTSFGISTRSDTLYLTDNTGALRDTMSTGSLSLGITSGRDGVSAVRLYFTTPTPGEKNPSSTVSGYAGNVTASHDDGYAAAGTAVSLTAPEGTVIRYTLDGTPVSESSPVYSAPLTIRGNMTLRARAYREGRLPGHELTRTYLTGAKHTLPVVCLTTDPDNLFDYNTGIFADGPGWTETFPHQGANYWKNWERDIHFSYYNEDGKLCMEANAGVKVFGQYSRAIDQKAMQIQFRKDYGINRIAYPFFEGNPVSEYSSLLLRASGQDWNSTKLRDAYAAKAIQDELNIDLMDSVPVVVYINGEYWGLYNLREKINEDYFETHYGVDGDNIDIIKANNNAVAGSNKEYLAFVESLTKMDCTTEEAYQYIDANMDLDNWMDYWIMEIFYCNTDSGNIKCWKEKGEGKWRWIQFDLDWGFNVNTANPDKYQSYAQLLRFLDPKGHGVGNNFSTKIARSIMKNKTIREEFVRRFEEYLDTVFLPDRMIGILDAMANQIRAEMPAQIERWGGISSMNRWESNLESIRKFLRERPDQIRAQLKYARDYR